MPESNALKDSTWHRAREDTERFRQSPKFFFSVEIAGAAMLGLLGGYIGFYLTPNHASPQAVYLYPAIGATMGLIFGVVAAYSTILFWNWFRAPYRQRDELRIALKQQVIPTKDKITEIVHALDGETFAVHRAGDETTQDKTVPFSKLLVACAYRLSAGASVNTNMETEMCDDLNLQPSYDWNIRRDTWSRFVGTLHREGVIERRDEDYQTRIVPITPIFTDPSSYNPTVLYPRIPNEAAAYIEKGTSTKYYLTPLGIAVVKELRHKG